MSIFDRSELRALQPAATPAPAATPVFRAAPAASARAPAVIPSGAPRTRTNFDEAQMRTESGGRQLDSNGRPLVGRYRDGSTPAPGKEAYGAGQMQIATARETARINNIAWDQNRFMNDREYNLDLADAHMGNLLATYNGDRTLARAAYHSGEPIVNRAIARYGREGFAQGLGPEGRRYIQMGSDAGSGPSESRASGGAATAGVGNPTQFLEGLASQLAPETANSSGVRQNSSAIFGSDAAIKGAEGQLREETTQHRSEIDILNQVTQVAQAGAVEAMTQQVNDTRTISQQITQENQRMQERLNPVFQARGRIADQLDELATMNPLERSLRGVFDLNYDQEYLEGQLDRFDRTLEARSSDNEMMQSLHTVALGEINRRYAMDTAIPNLMVEQANADMGLTAMRIQNTAGMLGNLKDSINSESTIIAARANARGDMMNQLDTPTLVQLQQQAQSGSGTVSFNGVEFSEAELRQGVNQRNALELNMEGARNAMALGRMDMADRFATNITSSLTRSQIDAAIANGGIHEGIQLNQLELANAQQAAGERDQRTAQQVANAMPAKLALETATAYMQQATVNHTRSRQLLGDEAMRPSAGLVRIGADLTHRLAQATRDGAPPEVITELVRQIGVNSQAYNEQVDATILRSVGGDTIAAGFIGGFIRGVPLDSAASQNAMVHFAVKGTMPDGVAFSDSARQVFREYAAAVQTVREQAGSTRLSEDTLKQRVSAMMAERVPAIMGRQRHDEIYGALPEYARNIGNNFGNFPESQWASIRSSAALDAATAFATTLQTSRENVQTMVRTGQPIPGPDGPALFARFEEQYDKYNSFEMLSTVKLVDQQPQIVPGQRNSTLMIDMLRGPEMQNALRIDHQARGSHSVAEYLVNPMAYGAVQTNLGSTAQGLLDGQAEADQIERQIMQNPGLNMLTVPTQRTAMMLKSIPDVGMTGAATLAPFTQQFFESYTPDWGIQSTNERFRAQDAAFKSALQAHRFDDPTAETYRRAALSNWDEYATREQGFFERWSAEFLMSAQELTSPGARYR